MNLWVVHSIKSLFPCAQWLFCRCNPPAPHRCDVKEMLKYGVFPRKTPVSWCYDLTWKCVNALFWVMLHPLLCSARDILFLFRGIIFLAMIQHLKVFLAEVHFDTEHHFRRKCQSENGICIIANIYQILSFLVFFGKTDFSCWWNKNPKKLCWSSLGAWDIMGKGSPSSTCATSSNEATLKLGDVSSTLPNCAENI